jgi:exo-beta-1,3-glucanase (GH17 family)
MKSATITAAAALGLAGLMALQGSAQTNITSFKPFVGLDYSPFTGSETPANGNIPANYPTLSQITNDFTNGVNSIVSLAAEISTYGMDGTLSNIAGICNTYGVKCFPCAYVSTGTPADAADTASEISALIAVGNSNYPTTRGLVVGSESMLQGYSPQTLISNINYVRAATHTNTPVGTRDLPSNLINNPGVVAASDFVMADIYAYWAQVPVNDAAAWTIQQWQILTNDFPGKDVLIGEANWPTGGTNTQWSNPAIVPSVANQGLFLSNFVAMANSSHIEYFIFEFRDEPWKVQENVGTVEQNWGIIDTNNVKKQSLVDHLSAGFSLEIVSDKTNRAQIVVQTYEGDPYSILGTTNLLEKLSTNLSFVGASGTNQTIVTATNGGGQNFYRAMQNF